MTFVHTQYSRMTEEELLTAVRCDSHATPREVELAARLESTMDGITSRWRNGCSLTDTLNLV